MRLLERYGVETSGRRAVVVGRSQLVGLPLSLLLARKGVDATVTMAHSRTADMVAVCREADILVAAAGQAHMITAEHVKPGAAVIDVGQSRTTAGVVGDVDPVGVGRGRRLADAEPGRHRADDDRLPHGEHRHRRRCCRASPSERRASASVEHRQMLSALRRHRASGLVDPRARQAAGGAGGSADGRIVERRRSPEASIVAGRTGTAERAARRNRR